MASRRLIRSAVGGWVEKSAIRPSSEGLQMNRCAVAGLVVKGSLACALPTEIWASALARLSRLAGHSAGRPCPHHIPGCGKSPVESESRPEARRSSSPKVQAAAAVVVVAPAHAAEHRAKPGHLPQHHDGAGQSGGDWSKSECPDGSHAVSSCPRTPSSSCSLRHSENSSGRGPRPHAAGSGPSRKHSERRIR